MGLVWTGLWVLIIKLPKEPKESFLRILFMGSSWVDGCLLGRVLCEATMSVSAYPFHCTPHLPPVAKQMPDLVPLKPLSVILWADLKASPKCTMSSPYDSLF